MIYTLTISPSIDYINELKKFEINTINRSFFSYYNIGGKGINVSLVLKNLNMPSYILGFKADFTGDYLEQQLNKLNIDNYLIKASGSTRVNVKVIGEKEFAINTDSLIIEEKHIDELIDKIKTIQDNDILIISGSIPSNINNNLYEKIIENIHSKVKIVIDAENELLMKTLKYNPFLIKPNREELGCIFDTTINTLNDAFEYARKLRKLGAQNVIISLDKDGAILVDSDDKEYSLKNAKGKMISSVGAGDSLIAGFICGVERNYSTKDSFILGVACGNATAYSNSLADKSSIEKMVELLKETNKCEY